MIRKTNGEDDHVVQDHPTATVPASDDVEGEAAVHHEPEVGADGDAAEAPAEGGEEETAPKGEKHEPHPGHAHGVSVLLQNEDTSLLL